MRFVAFLAAALLGALVSLGLGLLLCGCAATTEVCHAKRARGAGVCPRTREWELRFARMREADQCVSERVCFDGGHLCVLDDREVRCE